MSSPTACDSSNATTSGRLLLAVLFAVGQFAACQFVTFSSFGQDTPLEISQYARATWTSEDGLPQNSVFDLLQTSDGFLWIATQGGLARYDGAHFTTLTQEDGLPSNDASVLLEGADGRVWFGTTGAGVGFVADDSVTVIDTTGFHSNLIRALYEDRDGILWIGTIDGGLHRYDGTGVRQIGTEDGLAGNVVLAIHETPGGDLWVGTEGGLSRIRGTQITNYGEQDGLPGDLVWVIHEDSQGDMWIGTSGGLSRLSDDSFETFRSADGLCGDVVDALATDANGSLWIGTLGGGLCRMDTYRDEASGDVVRSFDAFASADGLANSRVRSIEIDDEHNVWVGTERGGLDQFRVAKFTHVGTGEGLSHDVAVSVRQLGDGTLAVGTEGGGLNLIDGASVVHRTTEDGLPANDVYALEEDALGRIWVGMYEGGVCRFAGPTAPRPERCFSEADGLPSNSVYSLHADASGRVWIGTLSGLAAVENDRVVDDSATDALDGVPVWSIGEDDRGRIWLGTYGQGIFRVRERAEARGQSAGQSAGQSTGDEIGSAEELANYSTSNGLASDIILTLHVEASGIVWAGTQGGGLCRIDEGGPACASSDAGVPSDVLQLLEDDRGYFWIGSLRGVHRVQRAGIEAFLDAAVLDRAILDKAVRDKTILGRAWQGTAVAEASRENGAGADGAVADGTVVDGAVIDVVHFDRSDGLRVNEMNGGTQPSAWKASDGRLWFTTNAGITSIDPESIRMNTVPPKVHVDCVHVEGTHIAVKDAVALPPGSRDVVFHYKAVSFTASEKVRYQYRLEGYDDAWIEAGSRREAFYTNLPSGSYRFVVRAANNDGLWSDPGAAGASSVDVTIDAYLYQRWWFILLCGLVLAGVGTVGYRLRINKVRAHERQLERVVDERTRDLRREKERVEEAKQVIEGQAEELRDLNDHLEAKVTEQFEMLVEERERYEADLIEAKERAEASDRLKTAILNNLNHEFRTPLTAILGFSEIIATDAADGGADGGSGADVQTFTTEIRNGGKRLLRTLDALLEFSRLESEQAGTRLEPVDLALTAAMVLRDFQESAARKQLTLNFETPGPVRSIVDTSAVEEIICKLVDNAIKFTSDGEITVSVGTHAGRAFIRVTDTGVGIGDDFLVEMYDAFTQESDGFSRTFEGVGLGLTITRRLVDQMDGEIDVETTKGKGTSFTVWFDEAVAAA